MLFLLAINYNTIVEYLPKLKTFYVAATATLPIILVTQILGTPIDRALWAATFLFVTGREILKDVEDRKGDGDTIAQCLSPQTGTWLGFSLPVLGAVALIPAIHTARELGAYLVIAAIFPVLALNWRSAKRRPLLLEIMKIQMFMGIVFLL
jgi:4-hydroxybenzoate polyprenyltransferase